MKLLSCISLDVSKDSSHIQAFDFKLNKLTKVEIIEHNLLGFRQITNLYKSLEKPIIVFEATGVYHRGLQKFLIESSIPYVMLIH